MAELRVFARLSAAVPATARERATPAWLGVHWRMREPPACEGSLPGCRLPRIRAGVARFRAALPGAGGPWRENAQLRHSWECAGRRGSGWHARGPYRGAGCRAFVPELRVFAPVPTEMPAGRRARTRNSGMAGSALANAGAAGMRGVPTGVQAAAHSCRSCAFSRRAPWCRRAMARERATPAQLGVRWQKRKRPAGHWSLVTGY